MKNKAFEKDGHVYCRQCGERIDSDPLNGLGNKKIIFRRQCKCDREEESLRKAKEEAERIIMNSRPKNPKYARNKNVLVIGGSGSGKTRFFVKPNLMQLHSSYVVTDPKGSLLHECGKMLEMNGYEIKTLNTINFKKV